MLAERLDISGLLISRKNSLNGIVLSSSSAFRPLFEVLHLFSHFPFVLVLCCCFVAEMETESRRPSIAGSNFGSEESFGCHLCFSISQFMMMGHDRHLYRRVKPKTFDGTYFNYFLECSCAPLSA